MTDGAWFKELPVTITVCDAEGIILDMNNKSCETFAKDGGKNLIGKNVLDCHPEDARSKLSEMLKTQSLNCYTIEKNGKKKLVYQTPWYQDGKYMGFVEFIIELP
ncbi:PAS domain-containing protein [Pelotomaculum propionicicum]|uniref:PAS domain-containing protein n=1 Tax=Pelotomaculum propionicicum TaxID=258475 RepID=UPI003B81DC35